jgi:hypothetical protein
MMASWWSILKSSDISEVLAHYPDHVPAMYPRTRDVLPVMKLLKAVSVKIETEI